MVSRRRREQGLAIGVALTVHAALFTAFLWRIDKPDYDDRAVQVEIVPFTPERPPQEPEPPREQRLPPKVQTPPVQVRAPLTPVPTTVAPIEAAPQVRPPQPAPPRAMSDSDALARSVLPGKAIDCRWPGLSAAERQVCAGGRSGPEDERFKVAPGSRVPNFAMERGKEVGFDAAVDRRKPEPPPYTATSRCDGWASDVAQRNVGVGCFPTSKGEGNGATRPKSKNPTPRGTPFEPMRRD